MKFFEYHQTIEGDARENYLIPATTITAGEDELWEIGFSENKFNEISYSYEVCSPLENNNI